jgi:hypothetical protein
MQLHRNRAMQPEGNGLIRYVATPIAEITQKCQVLVRYTSILFVGTTIYMYNKHKSNQLISGELAETK